MSCLLNVRCDLYTHHMSEYMIYSDQTEEEQYPANREMSGQMESITIPSSSAHTFALDSVVLFQACRKYRIHVIYQIQVQEVFVY